MNDQELTAMIEAGLRVKLHDHAPMDTIDAWAERDGQMIAYVERKTRNVAFGAYDTAMLDSRKWIGLLAAEFATGLPALLFYAWADGAVGWIRPASVGMQLRIRIATPHAGSVSLNAGVPRPVVDIPLSSFTMLAHPRPAAA